MSNFNDNLINEIKDKNDIIDVISSYISVIKKGRNYVCLCPFHNDTNPSMHISPDKQIYKCFSCGAGGNVISFVKDYEHITYREALAKLAQKAGINIDGVSLNYDKPQSANPNKKYYEINQLGLNLFSYLLTEEIGMAAYQYLEERHINNEIINKFNIGFGGNDELLLGLLKAKEIDFNDAAIIGMLRIVDNNYLNTYHDRIIYPIIDIDNNVLGFTARLLSGNGPKYINSVESIIFDKASIFYNINNAYQKALEDKEIYIVEGPNDVIAFSRAGIDNVVCVMGTSLSNNHLKLLKQMNINSIILGFDGDEAGQKANYHAIDLSSKNNFRTSYLDFDKLDPDEYLNKYGISKFLENIKNSCSSLEFKINYEFSLINTNNYSEKKKLVVKLINDINNNLDTFDRYYYYEYISKLSGISNEVINTYVDSKKEFIKEQNGSINTYQEVSNLNNDIDNASAIVLFFMINNKKYFEYFKNEVGSFANEFYRNIFNIISACYLNNDIFELSGLYNRNIDDNIIDFLANLTLQIDSKLYADEQSFFDAIIVLKKLEELYVNEKRLIALKNNEKDPIIQAKYIDELLKNNQNINEIKFKILNK
ncbi:MAG: DNA primase [Bacilli bacterium]|nr:DNA primase [Bacilli bacterium]